MQDIPILYQDAELLAVHKPAGMLVHRSAIDKHENEFLLQRLRDQVGQKLYPIHRLDKPTSGLLLFGLNPEAAAYVQLQFQEGSTTKDYILVCRGWCSEQGRVDHPLRLINDFRRGGEPKYFDKPAQEASTLYQRLHKIELDVCVDRYPQTRYSLVKAQLLTGRKHQLRRHFKHISHPIIGCPKYGKSQHNHFIAQRYGVGRLLLHAYRMQIQHPKSGETLTITAPLEGGFANLLDTWSCLDRVQ